MNRSRLDCFRGVISSYGFIHVLLCFTNDKSRNQGLWNGSWGVQKTFQNVKKYFKKAKSLERVRKQPKRANHPICFQAIAPSAFGPFLNVFERFGSFLDNFNKLWSFWLDLITETESSCHYSAQALAWRWRLRWTYLKTPFPNGHYARINFWLHRGLYLLLTSTVWPFSENQTPCKNDHWTKRPLTKEISN